jgi:arylsulfatase A-like enzyme
VNRREFLAAPLLAYVQGAPKGQKPNLVFILADDLGYGDLGCYGQQQIATPNIDRLAKEGLKFTQAYAGSTVCAPSRCALMTGLHTGHCTVRGNKRPELGLKQGEETVGSLLRRAGYQAVMFGKWGLGGPGNGSTPTRRGFDEFYGYFDQLHAHNFYPEHIWDNENEIFLTANWFDAREQYVPDLVTDRITGFLKRKHDKRFVLFATYTVPHANNERGRTKGSGMEVPPGSKYEGRDWPAPERGFAGMMERLDGYVGRILDALRESGLDDNTLVIFTSDNGPHREGGHDPNFFKSSGPLRGIKRDLYEGGIRVPFLARWPGKIKAAQTTDAVISFWDVLPTFAELAGTSVPKGIDGRSFAPLLSGRPIPAPSHLYWEFHEGGFFQAVRVGNWKGVRKDLGPVELYDLATDLGETKDVSANHPAAVKRIEGIMKAARTDSRDFPITKTGSSNTPF